MYSQSQQLSHFRLCCVRELRYFRLKWNCAHSSLLYVLAPFAVWKTSRSLIEILFFFFFGQLEWSNVYCNLSSYDTSWHAYFGMLAHSVQYCKQFLTCLRPDGWSIRDESYGVLKECINISEPKTLSCASTMCLIRSSNSGFYVYWERRKTADTVQVYKCFGGFFFFFFL